MSVKQEAKATKKRVEAAVEVAVRRARRDRTLGLEFASGDIEAWKEAAKARGEKLTDWVERVCNQAAAREGRAR